jgi:hypothetical protein
MLNIEIEFVNHILPQILSLILIAVVMLRIATRYKHSEISELLYPLFFLAFGKMSLIIFFSSPDFVKTCINASLTGYFATMPLILKRMYKVKGDVVMFAYLAMTGVIVSLLMATAEQGYYIFLADLMLIFILLFARSNSRWPMILSFAILGGINLFNLHFGLDYKVYAWIELLGQIIYTIAIWMWIRERYIGINNKIT